MARILICLLLISLNVFYALESHESEIAASSDGAVTAHFVSDSPCSDANHNTQTPTAEHACHLGHCAFTTSSFAFSFRKIEFNQFYSKHQKAPSPFLDEDVRPPIFS